MDALQNRKCVDFKRMMLESTGRGGGVGIQIPIGYDEILVLLYHCITVSLYYCIIVSLYHCAEYTKRIRYTYYHFIYIEGCIY